MKQEKQTELHMTIARLQDWILVPTHQEVTKFERYSLFYRTFIRLTPQLYRNEADNLVKKWVKIAKEEGVDMAQSIFNDYCTNNINPNLEESLLQAIEVITEGDYSHNTPQEVFDAHSIAMTIHKQHMNSIYSESNI